MPWKYTGNHGSKKYRVKTSRNGYVNRYATGLPGGHVSRTVKRFGRYRHGDGQRKYVNRRVRLPAVGRLAGGGAPSRAWFRSAMNQFLKDHHWGNRFKK